MFEARIEASAEVSRLDALDLDESPLRLPPCDCIYSVCNARDELVYVDSVLANNRAKRNRERGPQNRSRERRQAPCGSTSLLYLPRDKGGRGLRSIEREHKETKVKAAVKLFQNRGLVMKMVRDFEKRAESVGYQALTKEAAKYAEGYGLQLKPQCPDPACVTGEEEVTPGERLKSHLRK